MKNRGLEQWALISSWNNQPRLYCYLPIDASHAYDAHRAIQFSVFCAFSQRHRELELAPTAKAPQAEAQDYWRAECL